MRDCIAVVDVETTGLFPGKHDRIIEIAIVLTSPDGQIYDEYDSLINPERDLGPTPIHHITAAEVLQAPRFVDIAGDVTSLLRQARVIAGHNISFDRRFLAEEYRRLDVTFPAFSCFCTYQTLGRSNLKACCAEFNVPFHDEPHIALSDARATARLIHSMVRLDPESVAQFLGPEETIWPAIPALQTRPVPRRLARNILAEPPTFLQRIAAKGSRDVESASAGLLAYLAVLDRMLDDRTIDAEESEHLVRIAESLNLTSSQLGSAHSSYLQGLVVHALADGIVTDSERRDLAEVARLLGCDQEELDTTLETATATLRAIRSRQTQDNGGFTGKTVCFTGELHSRINGERITRELAETMAESVGMEVSGTVTKTLDLLVVADPNTQSGKAKKARAYGTRILAETVFWEMIGVRIE